MCYAHSRRSLTLNLTALCTGMSLVVGILAVYFPTPKYFEDETVGSRLLEVGTFLFRGSNVVTLLVLVSVRFQGRLDRLRLGGLILLGALAVLQPIMMFSIGHARIFNAAAVSQALVLVLLTVMLTAAAWAVAFRQIPPHRPPLDAGKKMALTCPRCGKAQEIALPNGACADCRLQIFVALDEGICGKCGYPLRGLTGDKCPECGTPFVDETLAHAP